MKRYKKVYRADYSMKYIREHTKKLSFEASIADIRRRQVLKSLNKYKHDGHILEIGCGLVPLFTYCKGYKSYTVVEQSRRFVQNAQKLVEGRDNINIIHGHIEEVYKKLLRPKYASFDFIVLSSILHEVSNYRKLLRLVHMLCNKNTVIHINVPNVYSFHRLLAYEMSHIKSIFEKSKTETKFNRYTRFDKQLLLETIIKSGFKALSCGTYLIKPFNNQQIEEIISKGIVSKNIIKGLENMIEYLPDLGCEIFVDVKISSDSIMKS